MSSGAVLVDEKPSPRPPTTVAVWQGPAVTGVTSANLTAVEGVLREAATQRNAALVVFPELFLCGYDCSKEQLQEGAAVGLDSDSLTRVAALAAELRVAVALPYAELASQSRLFNSCALFDATGALAANYRKVNLWGAWEKSTFCAGGPEELRCTHLKLAGDVVVRVGLAICYDLEFPEVARSLAVQGAELLLVPTALGAGPLDAATPLRTLPTRALENHVFVAYANLEGPALGATTQAVASFVGRSAIVGPDGEDIARAGVVTGGQLLCAALALDDYTATLERNPYLSDREARLAEGHYACLSPTPPQDSTSTTFDWGSYPPKPRRRGRASAMIIGEELVAGAVSPLLPDMFSIPNPTAEKQLGKRQAAMEGGTSAEGEAGNGTAAEAAEAAKTAAEEVEAEKKRRGRRVLCFKCSRPSRSICSLCGTSICSSSVGRPCFAQHVVDHVLASGWAPSAPTPNATQLPIPVPRDTNGKSS
uniref:CN hydrolase domain-containing protein n=1 Tax=Tetraselmis chuii TaxID=63592 RepID=A0A7S1T8W6_9CHLO|mmetsp:Transcript_9096/g.16396  ORF Transcript_9096/g.16396 Transcript_9096/m.16396 type:complete len:479 (+) Transcript_9096:126-1562(+)